MARWTIGAGLAVGLCAAALGAPFQDPASAPGPRNPLRRGDSVTLEIGQGGEGRVALPGGDVVVPSPGAVLRTVSELDPEGQARTTVVLESGRFSLEGRGGGPRIRVGNAEVLPGAGTADVNIANGVATLNHTGGGPVVVRLGSGPEARRVLLADGGTVELGMDGAPSGVRTPAGATGTVLVDLDAAGWAQAAPGTEFSLPEGGAPVVTAGALTEGATPPALPSVEPAVGTEEVAARLGPGGRALFLLADGSAAEAGPGASVYCRWSGGAADRAATVVCTGGTTKVTLRSGASRAETPAHTVTSEGATVELTVEGRNDDPRQAAAGIERFRVEVGGGAASFTDQVPHAGPRIVATVEAGDAVEYVAAPPGEGLRYRVPATNAHAVVFTVGSKTLRAPAGTEVVFREDGTVEVLWPDGPEPQFRFAFPVQVLAPQGSVAYTGLPELRPPQPVSPSTP